MTTTKTLKLSLARPREVKSFRKLAKFWCVKVYVELTVRRARLPLAVVAVVIARDQRLVNVDRVGDGLAETVTLENHVEELCCLVMFAGDRWIRDGWLRTRTKLVCSGKREFTPDSGRGKLPCYIHMAIHP